MHSGEIVARPKLTLVVSALIFLLPVTALVVVHGASAPYLLIFLISLGCLSWSRRGLDLDREETTLLALFLLYFGVTFASWAMGGFGDIGDRHVKLAGRLIMIIPVYLMLRQLKPDGRFLMYGLMTGAVVAATWAVADRILDFSPTHGDRASGATHPILFGDLALSMGMMSLMLWPVSKNKLFRVLVAAAFLSGMLASLLSASRGGWIALPALFAFMIWYAWADMGRLLKIAVVTSVLVVPPIIYMVPETGVQQRVIDAQVDLTRYQQGDTMNNSLGERLSLWEASWLLFKQSPVVGAGVGEFIAEAHVLIDKGLVGEFPRSHDHAHSMYFTALASQGMLGIIMLFSILLYPAWAMFRHLRSDDVYIRSLAAGGICLVIGYLHFGISEAMFTRSLTTIFYAFAISNIFILIHNRKGHSG